MVKGNKYEKAKLFFLYLGYFIAFPALTGLLTYLTYLLRISTLNLSNSIYFDGDIWIFFLTPWFFLSMVVLSLPLELLQFKLFPNKVPKSQQKKHLKITYFVIIIMVLITTPPIFLFFDFYTLITEDEIIKNNFFSINEEHYSFDEINSIDINGYLMSITFHLDTLVKLKNGNSFYLFQQSKFTNTKEIDALGIIKQKNVTINIVQQPSENDFNYVASLTKTPSGKKFDGLKKSQEAKNIFSQLNLIVND